MCTIRNGYYHGPCMSNKNCADSCIHDDVGSGGYCSSAWKRGPFGRICKCTFECGGETTPAPAGDEPPLDTAGEEISN
jgi:hypothetical protein